VRLISSDTSRLAPMNIESILAYDSSSILHLFWIVYFILYISVYTKLKLCILPLSAVMKAEIYGGCYEAEDKCSKQ
jgi:hypothetical protein